MSGTETALTVLTILLSVGGSQLIVALLRRRSEQKTAAAETAKTLEETASVNLANVAANVSLANQMRDQAMQQVRQLEQALEGCHANQRRLAENALSDRRHRLQAEAEVAFLRVENNRIRREHGLSERMYPPAPMTHSAEPEFTDPHTGM